MSPYVVPLRAARHLDDGEQVTFTDTSCRGWQRCIALTASPSGHRPDAPPRRGDVYKRQPCRGGRLCPSLPYYDFAADFCETIFAYCRADRVVRPYNSTVIFPNSIRRRLQGQGPWSLRRGSGKPFERFPRALFLLPGVFFLALQKENAVRSPFLKEKRKLVRKFF